jgi:predicted O-linked N-acetylglucosamine transferase (SPINDLY family)
MDEIQTFFQLHEDKEYQKCIHLGNSILKTKTSEGILSVLSHCYLEQERYEEALAYTKQCQLKFPSIMALENLVYLYKKMDNQPEQVLTLLELFDKTHDIKYFNQLNYIQSEHVSIYSRLMKWYREGFITSNQWILMTRRSLLKNVIFFMSQGSMIVKEILCIMYDMDEINDEIVLSRLEYKTTEIEQAFGLYYLLAPQLNYSSAEHAQNEKKRILYNLQRILLCPLEELTILNFIICFSHNISYFYTYMGGSITELLKTYSQFVYKMVPVLREPVSLVVQEKTRIRIGFFSSFLFKNHSVCRDRIGVIRMLCLDSLFDIVLITMDDEHTENNLFETIMKFATYTKVILDKDAAKQSSQIQQLGLDILVYPEIGMCSRAYLLSHLRHAPVQISTWGHSETSGVSTIDYYVSSKWFETDKGQDYYSEKLISMDSLSTYYYNLEILQFTYDPPIQIRASFGIFGTYPIYGIFQTVFKYHPETVRMIRMVLEKDPNGLVVLVGENKGYFKSMLEDSFGPLCSRIRLTGHLQKPEFCKWIQCMDILIDTYPFGGCNTSLDAFYFNKVVITCPSEKLNGRFTYGFYQHMGITEPICSSIEEVVEKSIYYAHHIEERNVIEQRIVKERYHLFEEFTSAVEWNQMLRTLSHGPSFPSKPRIVLSRYMEDISYLKRYDFPVTIYNKGSKLSETIRTRYTV